MSKEIAEAIRYAADSIGIGCADTELGAIEYQAECIKGGCERIALAIEYLADSIREMRDPDDEDQFSA